MLVRIHEIVDDRLCYEKVRELRWAEGVKCPHCGSHSYRRHGHHNSSEHRLRYQCKTCERYFDALTATIFEGHHQSLKVWILSLYLMGLNLSNAQIARELGLDESDTHQMTSLLREGVYEKRPAVVLSGQVEADELYLVAGHKGHAESVKKAEKAPPSATEGQAGRGTAAQDKPPVLGLIERGGQVRIWMLENVKRTTIQPLVEQVVEAGSVVYTDEYNIYNWLSYDYEHKTVNHSQGEYARDEDGDGKHEVHVNTMECFWSLLRPWLRVHRGLSQERLPYYLGFFEYLYNLRKRGQLALSGLLALLLTT